METYEIKFTGSFLLTCPLGLAINRNLIDKTENLELRTYIIKWPLNTKNVWDFHNFFNTTVKYSTIDKY